MTRHDFENAVKIMRSIDRHELERAGLSLTGPEWQAFSSDPTTFLIRCDDQRADAIWRVVEGRQTRRAA